MFASVGSAGVSSVCSRIPTTNGVETTEERFPVVMKTPPHCYGEDGAGQGQVFYFVPSDVWSVGIPFDVSSWVGVTRVCTALSFLGSRFPAAPDGGHIHVSMDVAPASA